MIIGVPREIKIEEYRVGVTPTGARELKLDGHTVLVEENAGAGSGFPDEEYLNADADVVDRETLFKKSDLIVKVKEPLPDEFQFFRENQAIFTYLHLAPNPNLTKFLLDRKISGMAYETLTVNGDLPLLAPMSEIAGRMAPLMGAYFLQKIHGGSGVLPSGVAGVKPARTVILGAGVVGTSAARVSHGMGMETVVINRGMDRLESIEEMFMGHVRTLPLSQDSIGSEIRDADVVVGAILVPGGRTPVLVTAEMIRTMKKGAVIVDVSVDQGGCAETSRPTTHDDPVYTVDGVIHYCVANMPGAYPGTSTRALTNATLPYVRKIAGMGVEKAISDDPAIKSSLNTFSGEIVHEGLKRSIG